MAEDFRVTFDHDKYTIIVHEPGAPRLMTFLRHGEPWPAADEQHVGDKMLHSLVCLVRDLTAENRFLITELRRQTECTDHDIQELYRTAGLKPVVNRRFGKEKQRSLARQEILRKVEWGFVGICPLCGRNKDQGHKTRCELRLALEGGTP